MLWSSSAGSNNSWPQLPTDDRPFPRALSWAAESARARCTNSTPKSSRTERRALSSVADKILSAKSARLARRLTEKSRLGDLIVHRRAQVCISTGLAPQA